MKSLKNYIYKQVSEHNLSQQDAKDYLLELSKDEEIKDIAIIGMAGKFPMADNLQEFWENIKTEKICIREFPEERRSNAEVYLKKFYKKELIKENRIKQDGSLEINYEIRGYMKEIDKFDSDFFGISPREARTMDPNQRLFLETAYEAMEDGGYCKQSIYGKKVGVFAGIDHVEELKYKKVAASDPMVVTGTWPGILASRVSYIFDFKGPSMVIDTACSSGLVSVHEACRAIKNKECDMAVAGGLSSFYYAPTSFQDQMKELDSIESKDDTVRTFDNHANGTTWGEGLGVVFLKPLKQAEKDGDIIHAVIKGSAINNDGASNGITAPSGEAQEKLFLAAWKDAGIVPDTIQYIEAHGTGTVLGDPIEIKSITNAFRHFTEKKQFCGIGSVKPSIGHLVGASGMASMLKVVMMLKNKTMAASLNFREPNRFINFSDSAVYINDKTRKWETNEVPRRAGINSFGFSGTNCHIILEEFVKPVKESFLKPFYFFTVSSRKPELLKNYIKNYIEYFKNSRVDFPAVCYTSNIGRGHYQHRVVLLVKNQKDLTEKLEYLYSSNFVDMNKFGVHYGCYKIVSENKEKKESYEITEGYRRKITYMAEEKMKEVIVDYDYPSASELCMLYVKGADIKWESLYQKDPVYKVNLPIYPLERVPYWYQIKEEKDDRVLEEYSGIKIGACIDRLALESMKEDVYITRFSAETHWLLSDHVILGKHIIPGTTYVEMALELCRRYYKGPVAIKEVVYYAPCIVEEGAVKEIQSFVIKKKGNYEFNFISRNEENGTWEKHAECSACECAAPEQLYSIENVKTKLLNETGESYIDMTPRKSEIALGTRWKNEKVLAVGKKGILMKLELPDACESDFEGCYLHVAMFDNAVNAVSQKVGEGLYLPYFYKLIEFYKPMEKSFYSYIRVNTELLGRDSETITYDVDLIGQDGQIFGKVRDYSTKKVNLSSMNQIRNRNKMMKYYTFHWVEEKLRETEQQAEAEKHAVVFCFSGEMGSRMISSLANAGADITKVYIGTECKKINQNEFIITGEADDYNFVFEELKKSRITHIIYGASCRVEPEAGNLKQLETNLRFGIYGLFHMLKALLNHRFSDKIHIAVIGTHAYRIGQDKTVYPENAALAALTKVIPLEYSNFQCKYVDMDQDSISDAYVKEILVSDYQVNAVYRKNKRFVEECKETQLDFVENVKIKEKGVYIITGGTGGLGLEMANYLASKQKVSIVLWNRSGFPDRSNWKKIKEENKDLKQIGRICAIEKLEQLGSEVMFIQKDVSRESDVKSAVQEIVNKYGTINGIFHCAGLAGDTMVISKSFEKFKEVLAPKVLGTFFLDQYTKQYPLDFLVLFSSMLSSFGDVGQSDYMSANAYLDAFAAYRNLQGRFTRVINWPAWKETGMAVDYGVAQMENTVESIFTADAITCLEKIIQSSFERVLPGVLNYNKIKNHIEGYKFRFSKEITDKISKTRNESKKTAMGTANIQSKWNDEYTDTENRLYSIWSNVLEIEKIDIYDSFSSLGGDSFLAIQLFKEINKHYENVIEISDIFTYPSIHQMAAYVDSKISGAVKKKETSTEEKMDNNIEAIMEAIQQGSASIEEAVKMLDEQ